MARVLLNLPRQARRGEVIEIRTLIQHPMESGFRSGLNGEMLARDIILRFRCTWDGEEVFSAEFSPAVAANPFLAFTALAERSGVLEFTWEGDNGFHQVERREITVA